VLRIGLTRRLSLDVGAGADAVFTAPPFVRCAEGTAACAGAARQVVHKGGNRWEEVEGTTKSYTQSELARLVEAEGTLNAPARPGAPPWRCCAARPACSCATDLRRSFHCLCPRWSS
jgi:hypothetical protein